MKEVFDLQDIDSVRLAQLVASRIHHDFVSPLAAVANGLELYQVGGAVNDEALDIIRSGVRDATDEIQFSRIAFGGYGGDEVISLKEIAKRAEGFLKKDNASIEFKGIDNSVRKSDAKLWFLNILCFRSSFLKLEAVSIINDERGWCLIAEGQGMVDYAGHYRSENHWLQLVESDSSHVHFPLFFHLLETLGYDYIRQRADDRLNVNLWRRS